MQVDSFNASIFPFGRSTFGFYFSIKPQVKFKNNRWFSDSIGWALYYSLMYCVACLTVHRVLCLRLRFHWFL